MGCDENNCATREDVKKEPENDEVLDKEESINMDIDPFPQKSCPPTIIIPKKK